MGKEAVAGTKNRKCSPRGNIGGWKDSQKGWHVSCWVISPQEKTKIGVGRGWVWIKLNGRNVRSFEQGSRIGLQGTGAEEKDYDGHQTPLLRAHTWFHVWHRHRIFSSNTNSKQGHWLVSVSYIHAIGCLIFFLTEPSPNESQSQGVYGVNSHISWIEMVTASLSE